MRPKPLIRHEGHKLCQGVPTSEMEMVEIGDDDDTL